MAVRKSKLYNAFGEVIYTMAMADGYVHEKEISSLHDLLADHEWARGIKWSFDYEHKRNRNLNDVIKFSLMVFKENGPSDEYPYFLDVLKKVAEAHDGIVEQEQKLIDLLHKELPVS